MENTWKHLIQNLVQSENDDREWVGGAGRSRFRCKPVRGARHDPMKHWLLDTNNNGKNKNMDSKGHGAGNRRVEKIASKEIVTTSFIERVETYVEKIAKLEHSISEFLRRVCKAEIFLKIKCLQSGANSQSGRVSVLF